MEGVRLNGKHLITHVLEALLDDTPLRSRRRAADDPPFVIEVAQYNKYSSILWAQHIARWHLDIIKGYICSASRRGVGRLDGFGGDAFATLNEEDREAAFGAASHGEIIAELSICDPPA